MIRPGMVAVDVGANVGTSAVFFLELVGPSGRVYAFEPEPKNLAILKRAVAGKSNVQVVNAAVGDKTGVMQLYLSDDLNVDHHTYDDGEGRATIEVSVLRLDDFFPAGSRVDLLKIDIQGFELQALQGSERVLCENHDIKLLIEYWPYGLRRAGTMPSHLLDYLRGFGFSLDIVGSEKCRDFTIVGNGPDDYVNIIAVRES